MVRVCPELELDTVSPPPVAVADSTPVMSLSVAVKVSPVVLPLSVTLTPVIISAWVIPIVCAGVVSTGAPFTVTAIC